jgi:hypothetical protein
MMRAPNILLLGDTDYISVVQSKNKVKIIFSGESGRLYIYQSLLRVRVHDSITLLEVRYEICMGDDIIMGCHTKHCSFIKINRRHTRIWKGNYSNF